MFVKLSGALRPALLAVTLTVFLPFPVAQAKEIAIGSAMLSISDGGQCHGLQFKGNSEPVSGSKQAFCFLEAASGRIYPANVVVSYHDLHVTFSDDSRVHFLVEPHEKFSVFRLQSLDLKSSATGLALPMLPVPAAAEINPTLNSAQHLGNTVAVVSASPEIVPIDMVSDSRTADLKGCSHSFTQIATSTSNHVAEFVSTNSLSTSGWSMQGTAHRSMIPRTSVTGIRARVNGDGKGQQLKFQLTDDGGGATDYYLLIDFTGWREVTLTNPAYHQVKGETVTGLNLYYNGVPAETTVRCQLDNIYALVTGDATQSVLLADFETDQSPWWNDGSRTLGLHWDFRYTKVGDAFGVIASPSNEYFDVMQEFEARAGIVTPYPGGVWNKKSQATNESYLFLTSFSESQFDEALTLAKRGGFKWVLLEQHSWCKSTGHYEINTANFPEGLKGLVRTVNRFRDNGIKVGLHLLGASIDSNDPYLTPVPDERLVKDAKTSLTEAIDVHTTTIRVNSLPAGFPAEDGGYTGDGTVLQIGSELVKYSSRTTTAPFTFYGCSRGYLGTRAAGHSANDTVHHLARSYGYHMLDMDTSLLDEVTSNFAAVANACNLDMVYFDGSERLQGDHKRYNSSLINSYVTKLHRKDVLVQASSFSHYSWHQLARTASADGHGDLKGYLEERASSFDTFAKIGIPLDIGWYYGYDTSATPDMFEYILGATIGYGASFSFQVSVAAAKKHPFTHEILDLVNRYEKLRLSRRVDDQVKGLLRVHPDLVGKAPENTTRNNSLRRDYRLISKDGQDLLQRVIYGDWHQIDSSSTLTAWNVNVTTAPAVAGVQLQVLPSESNKGIVNPVVEINGQRLGWDGIVQPGEYLVLWPGEPARLYSENYSRRDSAIVPPVHLKAGKAETRFTCDEGTSASFRIRVNLHCPEKHIIP